jgi:dTDP-4-dehydrorhamnose 3,5-epimerase
MSQFFKPDQELVPNIFATKISGLLFCQSQQKKDDRGFFSELSIIPNLNQVLDKPFGIKQINHAHSRKNVIRGFHAESWNKLVTVTNGSVFSVLVDIRPKSPTFGQYEAFKLGLSDDALYGCIYIPVGIANSVCVAYGDVDYLYFVDQLYKDRNPSGDQAISLFDPDLNIDWPIAKNDMIISDRDKQAISLKDLIS